MSKDTTFQLPDPQTKMQTEYSMWGLDYLRFDNLLKQADELSIRINSVENPTIEDIQSYYSVLNVIFKSWGVLIFEKKDIQDKLDNCLKKKRRLENDRKVRINTSPKFMYGLIKDLDEIHSTLLEKKQFIGLGMKTTAKMSTSKRIKDAFNKEIKKDYLPEK